MQPLNETDTGRSGTLMLHLLGRCNLTCRHCYMEGAPGRRERLPLDRVLDAIDDCTTLGIGSLYLTGGEPLLYPGLAQILQRAAAVPGLESTLCTNGTLLSPRRVDMFAHLGLRLNVSIDGDPQFHDSFRNREGAFAASERGIGMAVAAGIQVNIVTTVSRANLAAVPGIAEWAAKAGVRSVRFQPLLKLGRGAAIGEQRLSAAEVDRLVLQVSDLANRNRDRLACAVVGHSRRFLLAHPCAAYVCNGAGCHRRIAREIKKIVIRENGDVLPEASNLDPAFAIGHIEDGRLPMLVSRYLDQDYERFDRLCRGTYAAVLPHWEAAIVPWDQLLADSSREWRNAESWAIAGSSCGNPSEASAACGRLASGSANQAEISLLLDRT
jgi:MoaA/NifB/PqqE/SkfB family radical SAM enzyme